MESFYILTQNPLFYLALTLALSFLLDLLIGDPPFRAHPIRVLGSLIQGTEAFLRKYHLDGRLGGLFLVFLVEVIALYVVLLTFTIASSIHFFVGFFVAVIICFFSIALKDLIGHVNAVLECLENGDRKGAIRSVAMVVGRDVSQLDQGGITRAAIETLAENFVDGFFAPIFWFCIGGLWGYFLGSDPMLTALAFIVAFKVANTLDSMVGYKSEEYLEFGCASARLDDLFNYLPARASVFPLFLAGALCRKEVLEGLRIFLRDRAKHDSPNAAHAESFFSGLLGVRLGGVTRYPYGIKEKPWLGEEFPDPLSEHIREALCLVRTSAWVGILSGCMVLLLVGIP